MRALLVLLPFWALASGDSCSHSCPRNRAPVCAHSPAHGHSTFANRCLMDYANQCKNGRHVFLHDGDCNSNESGGPSQSQQDCNQRICTDEYRPLCARSARKGFKTFSNTCNFEIANQCDNEGRNANLQNGSNSSSSSSSSSSSESREGESSEWGSNSCDNRVCPREYLPVCARSSTKGYKTFPNRCIMNQANQCQNKGYSVQREGRCTAPELNSSSSEEDMQGRPSCQKPCTRELNPVCALSPSRGFKTFDNRCLMERENQCYHGDYNFEHNSRCNDNEKQGCTLEYAPVCARSPTKGHMTFATRCLMRYQNDCKGGDFHFQRDGRCNRASRENQNVLLNYDVNPY